MRFTPGGQLKEMRVFLARLVALLVFWHLLSASFLFCTVDAPLCLVRPITGKCSQAKVVRQRVVLFVDLVGKSVRPSVGFLILGKRALMFPGAFW